MEMKALEVGEAALRSTKQSGRGNVVAFSQLNRERNMELIKLVEAQLVPFASGLLSVCVAAVTEFKDECLTAISRLRFN